MIYNNRKCPKCREEFIELNRDQTFCDNCQNELNSNWNQLSKSSREEIKKKLDIEFRKELENG